MLCCALLFCHIDSSCNTFSSLNKLPWALRSSPCPSPLQLPSPLVEPCVTELSETHDSEKLNSQQESTLQGIINYKKKQEPYKTMPMRTGYISIYIYAMVTEGTGTDKAAGRLK